jgi:Zn-dependent M28 family amino/carboxypeptidase
MSLADPNLDDTKGHVISIVINSQNADKFLAGTGHTAAELIALDDAQKPLPKFPLKAKIDATIDYTSKTVESDNVIGVLPGSDPKLKAEYVVLGAHLDHIGVGKPINGDSINNGAMDDASGIATLIEVARGLAATPDKLKRSVMFLAVCGEEKGLLGSKYFASHPTVKAESMIADINSDMFLPLIPLREVTVYGIDESTLGDDFREVAKEFGIKIEPDAQPERNVFIRSDQYNFILHGIPAVFTKFSAPPGSAESKILSDWIHTRYHSPSDDVNQPVDKEAAVEFDRLMAALTRKVANQAERPQWKPTSFFRRFAKPS